MKVNSIQATPKSGVYLKSLSREEKSTDNFKTENVKRNQEEADRDQHHQELKVEKTRKRKTRWKSSSITQAKNMVLESTSLKMT